MGACAQFDNQLQLATNGARVAMERDVQIDGARILLNSPGRATDAPRNPPRPKTRIQLRNHAGVGLAQQRFTVDLEDGSQAVGITDEEGRAELDLSGAGAIRFHSSVNPLRTQNKGRE